MRLCNCQCFANEPSGLGGKMVTADYITYKPSLCQIKYIKPGMYVDRLHRLGRWTAAQMWLGDRQTCRLHTLKIVFTNPERQVSHSATSQYVFKFNFKRAILSCPFLSKIDGAGGGEEHFERSQKFRFRVCLWPCCFRYVRRIYQKVVRPTETQVVGEYIWIFADERHII